MLKGMGKKSEKPKVGQEKKGQTESKPIVPSGETGKGQINHDAFQYGGLCKKNPK